MLYQFFPAPGAASPAAAPFVWQCDACEAKQLTKTPLLPADWTDLICDDEDGLSRIVFCPECSACENRGDPQ